MKTEITQTALDFTKWIHDLVTQDSYIILHYKDYPQAKQHGDKLLGYYDTHYIYIIPDTMFRIADRFMTEHNTDIKGLTFDLWRADFIKMEYDGDKYRYRHQKRIGLTKKRFFMFKHDIFFSKEECIKLLPYHF